MIDAFGVEISKGLPSYVKGVQLGKIKPSTNPALSYKADLINANNAGKQAATIKPDNIRRKNIVGTLKRNKAREKFKEQIEEGQRIKRRLPMYSKVSVSKAFTPRNPDFSMQGREVLHLGRKARIHTYDGDNMFTILNHRDDKVFVHKDQLKFLKKKRSESSIKPLVPSKPPKPVQGTLFDIGKSFIPKVGAKPITSLSKPEKQVLRAHLEGAKDRRLRGIVQPRGNAGQRPKVGSSAPIPKVTGNARRYQRQVTRSEWKTIDSNRRKQANAVKFETTKKTNKIKDFINGTENKNGYMFRPSNKQLANIAAGSTVGTGLIGSSIYDARKQSINKSDRNSSKYRPEILGAAGGVVAGRVPWEGGGWAAKRTIDSYQNKKYKELPKLSTPIPNTKASWYKPNKVHSREQWDNVINRHGREFGAAGKPTTQDFKNMSSSRKLQYFASYPKLIQGSSARRALAFKNKPAVATAYTVGTAAIGAGIAHNARTKPIKNT